jgi:hypothetical protein
MVLGIAGPIAPQQSAPNVAKHALYAESQDVAHHAYRKATYPGKKFSL